MVELPQSPAATSGGAQRASLTELALFFLRLGTTAFGGPAAHIAMMEDELIRRRKWLSREKFLDLLGASNLIPGPSSSELAIHIGYLRAGWLGLVIGGICFIFPAAILVAGIAWAYVRFGYLPEVSALLYGVKPVVVALILQALWGLGRTAVKSSLLAAAGVICVALSFLGVNALLILGATGTTVACAHAFLGGRNKHGWDGRGTFLLLLRSVRLKLTKLLSIAGTGTAAAAAPSLAPGMWALFLVFLKIGSVVFGSGYVLLAFLRTDLVVHRAWITDAQLVDDISSGVPPGGRQRAACSLHPAVGDGGRVPRRSKCCVAGLDGGGQLPTRACRNCRLGDCRLGHRWRNFAAEVPN